MAKKFDHSSVPVTAEAPVEAPGDFGPAPLPGPQVWPHETHHLVYSPDNSTKEQTYKAYPKSLSRRVQYADPLSMGCTSLWLFVPVAVMVGIVRYRNDFAGSSLLLLLALGALAWFAGISLLGKGFQRLHKWAYLDLPGRLLRDQHWLEVWAAQHYSRLTRIEAPGKRPFFRLEPVTKEILRVRPHRHSDVQRLLEVEQNRALWDACTLTLDVEPQGEQYAVRIRLTFPPEWQEVLHSIVAPEEVRLGDFLAQAPFDGEEDKLVRLLLSPQFRRPMDRDTLYHADATLRWFLLYEEPLYWATKGRYWEPATSSFVYMSWCELVTLERILEYHCTQAHELRNLLLWHGEPLLPQVLARLRMTHPLTTPRGESGQLSWTELRQEHEAIEEYFRACWWAFLCTHCRDEPKLTNALPLFFLVGSRPSLDLFLKQCSEEARTMYVLPAMLSFVWKEWRLVLVPPPEEPLPKGLVHSCTPERERALERECFDKWLSLFRAHLLEEELLLHASTIAEIEVWLQSLEPGVLDGALSTLEDEQDTGQLSVAGSEQGHLSMGDDGDEKA